MTKKNILTIILNSIFVVAFNVFFFVYGGTSHTTSIWICYGFLHFSYLMVLLTSAIETKEYISKLTTYSISLTYFLIELILAIVAFYYGASLKIKIVISVQTILTALYLIILVSNLLANDATASKQARHNIENDFIKTISAKAKYIESITEKPKIKSAISNLYYAIHSSPIKSLSEASVYEEKITNLLDELEESINQNEEKANELILEIDRLINKRNFTLKSKR